MNNRTEWAICAYATYGLECSWVPMYEKELFQTWKYIIRDSCIKILFVSTHAIYNEVKGLTEKIPTLKKIFVIESDAEHSMMALEAIGNGHPVKSKKPVHSDTAILIQQKDVQNLISKEIRAHLKGTFGGYEIPRKLLFLAEDFTLANGMLTQTLKLKRRNILKKYGAQIESLYDEGIQ